MKRSEHPQEPLEGNCLCLCSEAQLPPPPPLRLPLWMVMGSHQYRDGSPKIRGPRDPSKDPTPRQRPSKASWSPLPFPLRSEAERVANIHTIFEMALKQTRPSLSGFMTTSRCTSPINLRSSWYTSPMCYVCPSLNFISLLDAPLQACAP